MHLLEFLSLCRNSCTLSGGDDFLHTSGKWLRHHLVAMCLQLCHRAKIAGLDTQLLNQSIGYLFAEVGTPLEH